MACRRLTARRDPTRMPGVRVISSHCGGTMRRASCIVAFSVFSTLAGAAASRASAQVVRPDSARAEIVTAATGEAQFVPDRAAVYVGVETRASTAAAAARTNADRQRAVIDAVVALGISRDQISTENYSVAPDTRYDQATQRTSIVGYVVSNVVRVEVRRIEQVASVLDAALAKGANQINSLDFFASNSDSARHEAIVQAVARARSDAETLARAAGGSLGPLVELSTGDAGPRPMYRLQVRGATMSTAPTPIEPGQQRVQVSVNARWRFLPSR
jgi:uncharacterized protein YggE